MSFLDVRDLREYKPERDDATFHNANLHIFFVTAKFGPDILAVSGKNARNPSLRGAGRQCKDAGLCLLRFKNKNCRHTHYVCSWGCIDF